jgi:hypothetical protein
MNYGLVSDITFAGGQPATEAEMQAQAAVGFTLLAFCKGPLVCLPFFGIVAFCALINIVLISVRDVNSRASDFKGCACLNSRSSDFPYRGTLITRFKVK